MMSLPGSATPNSFGVSLIKRLVIHNRRPSTAKSIVFVNLKASKPDSDLIYVAAHGAATRLAAYCCP